MYKKIISLVKSHKELFIFTILNYIDKLLLFILPLLVIFISKKEQEYNDIEYVLSISNIIVPILNFITIYAFYGYRQADNKNSFPSRVQGYFFIITIIYCILGLLLYPFIKINLIDRPIGLLYVYICIHTLYSLIINFYNVFFRLIDKPSKIFIISIPANIFSLLSTYIVYKLKSVFIIQAFFSPRLFIVFALLALSVCNIKKDTFKGLVVYLKGTIKYTIPLIINMFCVTFISNYGKIYAYNFLSSYDMYKISYVMRISMIITMMHASILAYYGKYIFMETRREINKKILLIYSFFIFAAIIVTILALYIFNFLPVFEKINIDISVYIILIYAILHCFSSFFETYYNRQNKTIYILLFSLISLAIYLFLLFVVGVKGIISLSLYMMIYMIVNMFLLLTKLKSLK